MSHLTEEQFEDIIQGKLSSPRHLADCNRCKDMLAEKTAMVNRLRNAFTSIKPNEHLAHNIRMQLTTKSKPKHAVNIRFKRMVWSVAAAVMVTATILGIYLVNPSSAMAAKAELVEFHKHNLSASHEFYTEANPEKLADYFKRKLGLRPSMPIPSQGMAIRGCCVSHFRGRIAGSYVVDTPQGVISVIVVTDKAESLGIGNRFEQQGRVFWKSSFAKCNMVTIRLGDYSYCAVGEISHKYLTELLSRLMPETRK